MDGKQHLQERLSTALEMAKAGAGTETWRELLVTDAASHLKDLDPRRLVQFRLPKASRWALLLLALGAGLGFVPEYRSKNYLQKQADQKVIKETGRQLVDLTKRSLAEPPAGAGNDPKGHGCRERAGRSTREEGADPQRSVEGPGQRHRQAQGRNEGDGQGSGHETDGTGRRSPGGETSPEAARLQKQIEDAQKQLGNPTGTPEDMDKMNKELDKIQEAAKAAADKNGGMSQADKEKISQSMAALSKQAQEMGMQMPNLDQAIQALAANQTDMLLKDLEAPADRSGKNAGHGQEPAADAAADGKDGQGPRRTIEERPAGSRAGHACKR